ncbi:GTP-binding protein SAR1a-like [Aphidius gifuensis]|uniref:GTP-binding protein SAR1a-like n=1 Tax=Aphidius gifuensis TaxID=684658 RepID=UPI001CDD1F99|nr:GTP-binding protein SAR1a-like [Aphidius gifuensis]
MFLYDWIFNGLDYLGLWRKSGKLLFLGLGHAGKTTLFHLLKTDRLMLTSPTFSAQCEKISIDNRCFTTYDLGGHFINARKIWRDYFSLADAIVFLIDANDRSYFPESKIELEALLTNDDISSYPILILGNKIDRKGAASETEILEYFNIHHLTTGKGKISRKDIHSRPLELFMCSVLKREGYGEGFRWLSQYID